MDPKKKKNILLSCGVLLAVVIVILALVAITGVGISLIWPFSKSDSGESEVVPEVVIAPTESQLDTETATEGPDVISEPAVESTFPTDLMESATTIEEQVQELRGLNASEDFTRALMSEADLEDTVKNEFFADYTDEEAQQDSLVLSALGLIPPNFDLKQLYIDMYSEQIAGYYDDEIKTMFVVQDSGFGGVEKMTYAHEYTHVLQDQVYGFDDLLDMSEEVCEVDSEKCAAIQALVEGDAVTSEILWFQNYATKKDYADYLEYYNNYSSPVLDGAPTYFNADLSFPYSKGQTFVDLLYTDGGYARVDEVYQNLPVSTEQIMHPERYPNDTPIPVVLPDLTGALGEGWSLYDQNVMGEWYTFLIFNEAFEPSWQLSEPTSSTAAEGWGGDAYAVYLNDNSDELVFILDYVWDTTSDANEFAAAFKSYAGLRWDAADPILSGHTSWIGLDGVVDFFQVGNRTVWVIAPDSQTAMSVMTELE